MAAIQSAAPALEGAAGLSLIGMATPIASLQPLLASGLVTLTAQTFVAFLCTAASTVRLTTLGTYLHTAGATPGAGVNQLGIYSAAGVLLGQTVDMTTAMQSAGLAEGALTAPVQVQSGTNYYLALLPNFTGTAIQTIGFNGQAINSGLPLFGGLYPCLFTGSQASLPASFTPSALGPGGSVNYVYGR